MVYFFLFVLQTRVHVPARTLLLHIRHHLLLGGGSHPLRPGRHRGQQMGHRLHAEVQVQVQVKIGKSKRSTGTFLREVQVLLSEK